MDRYPAWWLPAPNPNTDPNAAAFQTGAAQSVGTGFDTPVSWLRNLFGGPPSPAASGAAQSGIEALSNNAGLGGLLGADNRPSLGAGGLPPAYLNPLLLGLVLNAQPPQGRRPPTSVQSGGLFGNWPQQ